MHFSINSGAIFTSIPSASITSAEPELLEKARFPCFAILTPAPAAIKAAVVDILNVEALSPPVPHKSTTSFAETFKDFSLIISVKPISSSVVSPFMLNAVKKEPICASVALPSIMEFMAPFASSRLKSSLLASFEISLIIFNHPYQILYQPPSSRRQNALRVKLHPFYRMRLMSHSHYDSFFCFG